MARRRKKKSNIKLEVSKSAAREIWGIFFALLAVLAFLALAGQLDQVGETLNLIIYWSFGKGSYLLPPTLLAVSVAFFTSREVKLNFTRIFGIFLLLFGALGFMHTFLPVSEIRSNANEAGGALGFAASFLFWNFFGLIGARVFLLAIFLVGLVMVFPVSIVEIISGVYSFFKDLFTPEITNSKKQNKRKAAQNTKNALRVISSVKKTPPNPPLSQSNPKLKTNQTTKKSTTQEDKPLIYKQDGDWQFPSLELLSAQKSEIFTNERQLLQKAEQIKEKLAEFGVDVEMGPVHVGPTVTQFTLKPAEGVKLTKITNLKHDLALALSAKSLRIEAPIPGKDLVGIEIPNDKRTNVHLREIIEDKEFRKIKSSLTLALGRDVSGEAFAYDLASMPHLLIAGATGAGKSVGMNTFLISLLYQNSPADLKLILIDPKRVELATYNNLPHLLTPVIVDADKALNALRWSVAEMMRRYTEMSEKGYRNISEYNAASKEKMPRIVIVIDELADLMMRQQKKETEAMICRIAQMARAVGMHLVIATQRPSVDVITGLIKANVPTRISFAVTSSIDSRTILDSVGAEDLLGMGDMLFTSPAIPKPIRIQGIWITPKEIEKVTNHIKLSAKPEFDDSIVDGASGAPGSSGPGAKSGGGDSDDLLDDAVELIRSSGKASASLLQRRLSVGYARAARILDIMEEKGMIGPARGAKPREIYL
jgi:S-DNA-T family DNA segregation ATPase FtsK/SpoIIIE